MKLIKGMLMLCFSQSQAAELGKSTGGSYLQKLVW